MKAGTRDKKSRWCLHKLVLLAALAGMALTLTVCQATPTPAATMAEELNDFLRGPPFEFECNELQPAGEAAQTEAFKPLLELPHSQLTGPTLDQIKEFSEAVLSDNL